jgi:hypothetical protein
VPVKVMHVWYVRVHVPEPAVNVNVGVRFAGGVTGSVLVPMVFIVHVRVRVCRRFVHMVVFVVLAQMQPHAGAHEDTCRQQLQRERFAEKHDRDERADERRGREIGACPRSAKVTQRENEQNETDAVSEESDDRGHQCGPHLG